MDKSYDLIEYLGPFWRENKVIILIKHIFFDAGNEMWNRSLKFCIEYRNGLVNHLLTLFRKKKRDITFYFGYKFLIAYISETTCWISKILFLNDSHTLSERDWVLNITLWCLGTAQNWQNWERVFFFKSGEIWNILLKTLFI